MKIDMKQIMGILRKQAKQHTRQRPNVGTRFKQLNNRIISVSKIKHSVKHLKFLSKRLFSIKSTVISIECLTLYGVMK